METHRFDAIVRLFGSPSPRRRLWHGLAASIGLGAVVSGISEAKKKRKKRKKKLVRNAFGCVDAGKACRGNDANCCSGLCEGKKPKKGKKDKSKCVAHNVGGCTLERDFCKTNDPLASNCDAENPAALCTETTGAAGFCADGTGATKEVNCQVCARDTDCEALGFPPGSACIVQTGAPGCDDTNDCAGTNGSSGTACYPPAV